MDFQKTKIYLDKLNREFARMSKDPDNIIRLDVDIMASHLREMYDAILSESSTYVQKVEPAPRPPEPPVEAAASAPPPPSVVIAPPPAPVLEEKPAPAPPPPAPEAAPAPPPAPVSAKQMEDYEALFEEKQARELSEKLSEMPIADLKKAIALNDRLLLTRELFAGDGQSFEATIQSLNGFSNFHEAKAYLIENCVVRYLWMDKKRLEEAKSFIKLVRRRYK